MSGGHFDGKESAINAIADKIREYIEEYEGEITHDGRRFLENTIKHLNISKMYADVVDLYICGDIAEEDIEKRFDKMYWNDASESLPELHGLRSVLCNVMIEGGTSKEIAVYTEDCLWLLPTRGGCVTNDVVKWAYALD